VQRKTGRNDSGFEPRIREAVNAAIRTWARIIPWPSLEKWGEVTYEGGGFLYLPADVNKVIWLLDKTNQNSMEQSQDTWDRDAPSSLCQDTVGTPYEFEDRGMSPTITTVSGPMVAFSTDSDDVIGVYFEGMISPSISTYSLSSAFHTYHGIKDITLNGCTPVTCSQIFTSLSSAGKTADSDGAIILQCNGQTVGIIGPMENQSTYRKIKIMNIPAIGTVFKYKSYCDPCKLTDTNQPVPWSVDYDFLVWKAVSQILWDLRETDRAFAAERQAGKIAQQHIKREEMFGGEGGRVQPEDME